MSTDGEVKTVNTERVRADRAALPSRPTVAERLTSDIAADLRRQTDLSDATSALLHEAADKLEGLIDILGQAENARDEALALLRRFAGHEINPCQFDHHGSCQMHGLHSPPCPVPLARQLLERNDR